MVRVVSLDCGMLHLAYTVADISGDGKLTLRCIRCCKVCNSSDTIAAMVVKLVKVLDDVYDENPGVCQWLVEQQTSHNIKMKCMSHCVQMYAELKGACTVFIQPRWVHTQLHIPRTSNYQQKKKAAIQRAACFLRSHDTSLMTLYSSLPKQDDTADAILQLLAWHAREYGSSPA